MSYFAKPNFIVYDEWFDYDLKKTKLDVKNKKLKTISNIHDYFYEQSNYKVGASENNLQFEVKINEKEFFNNNYLEKDTEKYTTLSSKNFWFKNKISNSKLKFRITKKIFSLSIVGILLIVGLLLLFISQSKKNEANIINKSFFSEKGVKFSKRIR